MEMTEAERSRLVRLSIAIGAGTVLFLYFVMMCYSRELTINQGPPTHLFVFAVLLGIGYQLLMLWTGQSPTAEASSDGVQAPEPASA